MKQISFLFLLLSFTIYSFNCQSTAKLTGTPISSNSWVGLEFSTPVKISQIGWSQSGQSQDNMLGIFEGSNDKAFYDSTPLYMITGKEKDLIEVACTQSFKYIRYVGPNGKKSAVSQIEVYGEESKDDSTEVENIYQPTNLPLIVINTENGQMPPEKDKDTQVKSNIVIIKDGKVNTKGSGTIKYRGNSTLDPAKKSFRIKFDTKTTVLDLPAKAKKWVLFANMYDKTLLRNRIGYEMSRIFGLKYTPACHHVDVIINGDFKGNYLLCDQIEVNENRVDITKMDSSCNSEPEVTGGYLIEGDSFAEKEPSYFKTNEGILFCIKYPSSDDITSQQATYIKNKFNQVEAEIYDNNLENIDSESFVRYFIIEDFAGNVDGVWSSFYLTKERGDEKIYFGPIWDLDLAFDNDIILYPTNEKKNFAFKYIYSNGSTQTLVMKLLSNEALLKKVKDVWKEMTSSKFTKEAILSFIDEKVELINESQKLNFIRWDILNEKQFLQPTARGSYEAEIKYLKEFIENRFSIFGQIVESATKESVNEEVQGGWGNGGGMWGFPNNGGNGQWPNWGNGGQQWPNWGNGGDNNGQNNQWPNWGNGGDNNGQNNQWPNWGNGGDNNGQNNQWPNWGN